MSAHPRIADAISASGEWWIVGTNPADALLVRGGDRPAAVRISATSGDDLLKLLDDANRGIAVAAVASTSAVEAPGDKPALPKPKTKGRPRARPASAAEPASESGPKRPAAAAAPAPKPAAPQPPARPPHAGEKVEVQNATAGLLVRLAPDEESITFRGREMELTARQARLAAILTPAAPQPVDRQFIIGRMWAGQPIATADVVLAQVCSELRAAVGSIGLDVIATRGVGIALAEKGPA